MDKTDIVAACLLIPLLGAVIVLIVRFVRAQIVSMSQSVPGVVRSPLMSANATPWATQVWDSTHSQERSWKLSYDTHWDINMDAEDAVWSPCKNIRLEIDDKIVALSQSESDSIRSIMEVTDTVERTRRLEALVSAIKSLR